MRRFAVSVIALVLAVGLSSARPDIELSNYPIFVGDILEEEVSRPRPVPTFPEFTPEIDPEFELEPVPENEEIAPPKLGSLNPCDACFEYMTALIDQLTNVAVPEVPVHPELPEVELEPEVPEIGRPLPETVPEDMRPLPIPVAPEVEINPIPIPVAPEVGIRPLPIPVAPEVGVVPIPLPLIIQQ
ncbi:protein PELPK1-like [Anoplophora glabripennis]|uniref:protein PELPK1-like n=1 Tax=Anoplophora glabripennis TaxID=217634 RepID=UPI00087520D2|nr:protein PELPK1-like [Anoplophora glabripennis]